MTSSFAGRFFIVAQEAEIASLRDRATTLGSRESTLVSLPPDHPLPEDIVRTAQVLVLEVDPRDEGSLRRVAKIRSERPELPIIAALKQADVSLVRMLIRQGVTDVASLPFVPDELSSQIMEQFARVAELTLPGDLSPMFSVIRSTGGCGATTVLTHLAGALAESGSAVCVVDLDLQGGDVASYLGEMPSVTISALLEAGDRLDNDLLRNAITETGFGFSLIAAPEAITPLDTVDVDQMLKILRLLRSQFDYVLLDLPAAWTDWTLSVALASSEVVLITDFSISSLRQAKRRLELLSSVGVAGERIKVVVNRAERKLFRPIGTGEVSEVLGRGVLATLTMDGTTLRSAQDQGLLITRIASKSRFASDMRSLANELR